MELIASDVEGLHRSFADLDAFFVDPRVDGAFNLQSSLGRGRRDEFNNGGSIREWPATPVLRDAAEEAVSWARQLWNAVD